MNLQIRKCKTWTSWEATEVANLNPDKFKNLSIPFQGETEEDFLNYLSSNGYELREEISHEIDKETLDELYKLWDPVWQQYANSSSKGEDSWLESGQQNPEFRKSGGFDVHHTTNVS